jgi:EpsI family protein
LAYRLSLMPDHIKIEPGTLAQLPSNLDGWSGRELPLEQAIIKRTDTDDHLSRIYNRTRTGDSIVLFVGYGVRARDLQPHRPDICYVSAGWTLADTEVVDVDIDQQTSIPCKAYFFNRGGLDQRRMVVVAYYVVDGEFCPDVSLLRSRVWSGAGGVKYVMQVQVASGVPGLETPESAVSAAEDFIRASTRDLLALMPDVETGR